MFKVMNLQTRLLASFLFMGLLVFIIAFIGWSSNIRLSEHINTLGNNSLPSIMGLWKINEGKTQIQSSERALLNTLLSQDKRQIELTRIQKASEQIQDGFKQYESAPRSEDENKLYQKFLVDWDKWKQNHELFMQVYQQFAQTGIFDPEGKISALTLQGKQNSPEMVAVRASNALIDKLSSLTANEESTSFTTATNSILDVIKYSEKFGLAASNTAEKDVNQTTFWVVTGMILGPIIAIILGIFFSIKIAKPLGARIAKIVNSIVASSTEIAATIEQQERTATQQAAAVNQTTTTMDELGTSSQVSAEQAEAAAAGAREVLNLVDGNHHEEPTNAFGKSSLRDKVGQIAEQILRLSEQTHQIGMISALVSELANQTNMLALNAAVEAVRAKEYGKGFSVVAAEIRKLAEQSKNSAERINNLVLEIQKATNSTVMVTDEGRKTVDQVVEAISLIAMNTQQISLTTKQQAVAIQQVVEAMNNINQGASQTASGISQTKVSTQQLNEAALNLKAVV
jgi:methyl-accepting chemotaxis protein